MLLSGLYRGSYLLSHAMSTGFVDERKNAIVRQNPANGTQQDVEKDRNPMTFFIDKSETP